MENIMYEYESLSTKEGFNKSLHHFRTVSSLLDEFEEQINLADILNEMLTEKEIANNQVLPIVRALLVDKYQYLFQSHNLPCSIDSFTFITDEIQKWHAVDIVIVYFHPDLGPTLINPKNSQHFDEVNTLKNNELVTIFAGYFNEKGDSKLLDTAIQSVIKLFKGSQIKTPQSLLKGRYKWVPIADEITEEQIKDQKPKPEKDDAIESTKKEPTTDKKTVTRETPKRITPYYSVPVSNELFHNGNVEAWKKIIQSYTTKYPSLEVYIYYDGERIHDIHSLFKWGKVKHGSTILFAVAGENIKDVAKLQRYLKQGASPQFEAFLKFPVSTILNLF